MRRAGPLAFLAVAVAAACGSYGDGDGEKASPPPSQTPAGSQDASTSDLPDGSLGPSIPEPTSDGPCDAAEVPSDQGIFVSPMGKDDNAGTGVSPVASLGKAFDLATGETHREIYVALGRYDSPSTLTVKGRDVRVSGGWKEDAVRWTRDCSPGRRKKTTLYVSASPALTDKFDKSGAGAGKIMFEGLSLATVSGASANISAYALFLMGEGPDWTLSDVTLVADVGRDGKSISGPPGLAGVCAPCANAGAGAGGGPGKALPPTFSETGFVPGDGAPGGAGGGGMAGTQALPPPSANDAFAFNCGDKKEPNCRDKTPQKSVQSGAGSCGCGGNGGAGGSGGGGGGASIAVFVGGARKVHATYTQLKTQGGGKGAAGGAGAVGSGGQVGKSGNPLTYDRRHCEAGPNENCRAEDNANPATLAGGAPGGTGGPGGPGGAGGPGAGGASFALVRPVGAVELGDGIILDVGPPGAGGDGAAAGPTGEQLDL